MRGRNFDPCANLRGGRIVSLSCRASCRRNATVDCFLAVSNGQGHSVLHREAVEHKCPAEVGKACPAQPQALLNRFLRVLPIVTTRTLKGEAIWL